MSATSAHDRRTVRRALAGSLTVDKHPGQKQRYRLGPFIPYLKRRIDEGVLNASKLYDEIVRQGYVGSRSGLRAFVHPYRATPQSQATVRFETEPGEQAQVDWGHFGYIEHYGRRRRLYGFIMTLGWSRASYLEFTVSTDAAWWLRCHIHAFDYFGGIPRVVLHDNLKTAVVDRTADGAIRWNRRYLDFADYYGFSPRACRPYRAQTKGKVESGVKYVRGNFWLGLHFVDLVDLNRQARAWLDETANLRIHGTTGEVPFHRLPLERLQSLHAISPFDTSLVAFRRVSKDCLVRYGGNGYSVPASYAGATVTLKVTETEQLLVLNAHAELVAEHHLVAGHNQRVMVPVHYSGLVTDSRPPKRALAIQIPARQWADLPSAPAVELRPLSWYDQLAEVSA